MDPAPPPSSPEERWRAELAATCHALSSGLDSSGARVTQPRVRSATHRLIARQSRDNRERLNREKQKEKRQRKRKDSALTQRVFFRER